MKAVLSFLAMGILAWVLWRLLARQEEADPDFQKRLRADERRARANREASARQLPPQEPRQPKS
ncbi:MAG: hypothetical protein FJ292_02545 [Planctomycetes bacterium]|nr:hypothetical protein [Planctomycetota bacterium]